MESDSSDDDFFAQLEADIRKKNEKQMEISEGASSSLPFLGGVSAGMMLTDGDIQALMAYGKSVDYLVEDFQVGCQVMVIEVPKELAKEKQKEIGEWTEGMDAYLGKRGVVAGVGDSFIEVKMEKEGKVIKWNPKLLQNEELKKFKRNDLVRVLNVPIAKAMELQSGCGGWVNGMQAYLGEMGMVHQVAPDRVGVNVNGNFMWLNPMLLEEFWELKEGDKVCLAPKYDITTGGKNGPLEEGDWGVLLGNDHSKTPLKVKSKSGKNKGVVHWYCEGAVKRYEGDTGVEDEDEKEEEVVYKTGEWVWVKNPTDGPMREQDWGVIVGVDHQSGLPYQVQVKTGLMAGRSWWYGPSVLQSGEFPFFSSCLHGALDEVILMLKENPSLAFERDSQGLSGFHLACAGGQHRVVNYLLQEYPSLRQLQNPGGETGLDICLTLSKKKGKMNSLFSNEDVKPDYEKTLDLLLENQFSQMPIFSPPSIEPPLPPPPPTEEETTEEEQLPNPEDMAFENKKKPPPARCFQKAPELNFEDALRALLLGPKERPSGRNDLEIADDDMFETLLYYCNETYQQKKLENPDFVGLLEEDEALAIIAYTVEFPYKVYFWLNAWLIQNRRDEGVIKNVGPFFRLFYRGLEKLPKTTIKAGRAVKVKNIPKFRNLFEKPPNKGEKYTFWGISSFSLEDGIVGEFSGKGEEDAILFSCGDLECVSIEKLSAEEREAEVLPLPPAIFEVSTTIIVNETKLVIALDHKPKDHVRCSYLRPTFPEK